MPKAIEAIYESGVFKPLAETSAKEHERYKIVFYPSEDFYLLALAEEGRGFDFLKEDGEDIYTLRDGAEV